jgi:hypothetical protein
MICGTQSAKLMSAASGIILEHAEAFLSRNSNALVAQRIEYLFPKQTVPGSNPGQGTKPQYWP